MVVLQFESCFMSHIIKNLTHTDVDECLEGLHFCHSVREFCINEIGKYRCEPIIISDANADRSQLEQVSRATFQPPVQECPDGFGYDLTTRQCLGKCQYYRYHEGYQNFFFVLCLITFYPL